MKERLAKLIDVKSIVTLTLTGVFGYLSIRGTLSGEQFMTVFSVIIAFYFGTQYEKNKAVNSTKETKKEDHHDNS